MITKLPAIQADYFSTPSAEKSLSYHMSGAGLDIAGLTVKKNKIILHGSYHCMNENGYWSGYDHFNFIIPVVSIWAVVGAADIKMDRTGQRKYFSMNSDYYYERIQTELINLFDSDKFRVNYRAGEITFIRKEENATDQKG